MQPLSGSRCLFVFLLCAGAGVADWTDWRGPKRDGTSPETNLPSRWSPAGENLAWKAPYGGRSAPVVFGNRLYMLNTAGKGELLQERLIVLNADTGQLVWEKKWTVYHSDVPPHRAAWSSPAVDPETGNIFVFGVNGDLHAVAPDGKSIWDRSLAEEFGIVTTHGGRTVSPVVEAGLVIVSSVFTGWGDQARAAHRFFAFDKKSGDTVYVSTPGGRPFDTTYSPPVVADVNGVRLLIAGGGDGTMHAIKLLTGEPVWKFAMSKRGVNTGAVIRDGIAYVSHSEENLDTNEMGLLAAIDATVKGDINKTHIKWTVPGFQGAFSSPVIAGNLLVQADAGANIFAFDLASGKQVWRESLGTIQKASSVYADGKIYVGTENGKFYILRPHPDRCEILSGVALGTEAQPEAIIASAAVSDGRVFVISSDAVYAIGKKAKGPAAAASSAQIAPPDAAPAWLQVVPAEVLLKPGQKAAFHARLFDAQGRFIRGEKAQWTSEKLEGAVAPDGTFTAGGAAPQAGLVKAAAGGLTGAARVRVIPPLPLSENFDGVPANQVPPHWLNTTGKYTVRQEENNRVLVKLADNPFTKRARSFFGAPDWHDYTVECDVRASTRRRQMGDAGIVAQRYELVMFGNAEKLRIESWQPETSRSVTIPFKWSADTWYRLKLRVENMGDGKVRARGKVWPAGQQEPAEWMIERVDPIGSAHGSAGIYADAPFEVFFDNLKVTSNQ